MRKELTTRERNEIIGLAVDYDADKYNKALDFMYENIDRMCDGDKSDCRILAALMVVSAIPNIETIEKFQTHEINDDSGSYGWYRWGRIIGKESFENEGFGVYGEINLFENEEISKEKFDGMLALMTEG